MLGQGFKKVKRLTVQGRWNKLITLLLRKKNKRNCLGVNGMWRLLANKLLKKERERRLKVIGKW